MEKGTVKRTARSDIDDLEKERIKRALAEGGSVSEEGCSYAQSLANGDSGTTRELCPKPATSDPQSNDHSDDSF